MFEIGVCEMCGSENRLYKAEVEGTLLNVCKYCAKFGKVVADVHDKKFIEKMQKKRKREKISRPLISQDELIQSVVEDFAKIIKEKRESLNLKQEDFAKKINEKVSQRNTETWDSLAHLMIISEIESFFKITFSDEDVLTIITIGDLERKLLSKLAIE